MISAMAVQPGRTHGIDVGDLLDKALVRHGFNHDFAWRVSGHRDAAQFSKALRGERHAPLDLWKVTELPYEVLATFVALYLAAVAGRLADQLRGDRLRMAKVDLPSPPEQKVVGS